MFIYSSTIMNVFLSHRGIFHDGTVRFPLPAIPCSTFSSMLCVYHNVFFIVPLKQYVVLYVKCPLIHKHDFRISLGAPSSIISFFAIYILWIALILKTPKNDLLYCHISRFPWNDVVCHFLTHSKLLKSASRLEANVLHKSLD